ncbi:ATP-binding protein [Actinokineospora enzanensis]|uniref:ATP-binding protein n=1 Tax=Actinokineospora enzanensis TaxID=155975 RepID=UPI0007C5C9FD|nr:LuxR C-terminal-related transcriptional regulator [Actinokineospora enzanensis]
MPGTRAKRGSPAGQLPADVTSFVGRKAQLAQAKRLMVTARLMTFTGFGGVGKTRLALRLAHDLRRSFRNGVRLVSLAPLTEPELLAGTVAEALGIRDQSTRPPLDALIEHLQDKHLLLVLDNCEHLVDAVGELVGTLLRAAPDLRIIATSRTDLNAHGEYVFAVPPLAVPDPAILESSQPALSSFEAIRLITDRAIAAKVVVTDDNLPDLARICQRLDGIPLAIELAAARLKTLSVAEVLRRLDDRFRLLTGGDPRIVPAHHQTLRATVDWSYELCAQTEQVLWARLAVFSGSFDLTAAEAVATCGSITIDDVLDLLGSLGRQSILAADTTGTDTRYSLGETLRQYGQRRLDELGHTAELRQRHHEYYLNQAVEVSTAWYGPGETELLAGLGENLPDIRTAMDYSLTQPGAAPAGLLLATSLARARFWFFSGTLGEGRMWLRRFVRLTKQDPDELHVAALASGAWLALCQGDHDSAHAIRAGYLEHAPRFEHGFAAAAVRFAEGARRWLVDAHPDAVDLLLQARDQFLALGASGDAFMADLFATMAAGFLTDRDTAISSSTELLAKAEARGAAWSISWARWAAGLAELRFGNPQRATTMLRGALAQQEEIGDQWGPVWSVEALAWAAAATGDFEYAARLLGAADQMRKLTGVEIAGLLPFAAMRAEAERLVRANLSEQEYTAAHARGSALSWAETFDLGLRRRSSARRPASPTPAPATTPELSVREQEIAGLIAEGLSNPDIAAKLVISVRTAETHVRNILTKLGLDNRQQIASWVTARSGRDPAGLA